MKRVFHIWGSCIRASLKAAAAYRANFIMTIVILLFSNALFPLLTALIYNNGAEFPGWGFYEALLIQAVFLMSLGLANMLFFGIVWQIRDYIVDGSFEMVLLRPTDSLWLTFCQAFNIEGFSLTLAGAVMVAFSLSKMPRPGLVMWLVFAVYLFAGLMVLFGLVLIMAATMFKWVGNSRIFEIFDSFTQFGRFPAILFPKTIMNLVTFVIPVAMIGFFPAEALLGQIYVTQFLAIIPCALFALAGIIIFKKCIKMYQSAGG